jgi:hypothetical protein
MRFVLIIRHPAGYISSWLRAARFHGWREFGDKQRLNGQLLPFFYAEHHKYAAAYESGTPLERELIYWIVSNESPRFALHGSPALMTVVYEELCRNPESVMEQICKHCGIPFCTTIRSFISQSTSRHSDGFHDVYKNPEKAMNSWHSELNTEQKQTIEHYLASSSLQNCWS